MGRVGRKRSDRRFRAPDGEVWASEYEFRVYEQLRDELGGDTVFRNEGPDGHTFNYFTKVKSGDCLECGSSEVVQRRTYTPDLRIGGSKDPPIRYYIETKGYFSAEKRNLLRSFLKTGEDIGLVLVLQNDSKATAKLTLTQYSAKYFKIPTFVWNPKARPTIKDPNRAACPPELLAYLRK